MAGERGTEGVNVLFGLVSNELAAVRGDMIMVREELARQKERVLMLDERNRVLENEVNELRRALSVVSEKSVATAAVMEERGRVSAATKGELFDIKSELIGVKGELTAVKRELNELKGASSEQLDVAERMKWELKLLKEEVRKGEDDMRAELAKERAERRREVQELNWPRAMEDLAACKNWVNVEKGISQSEGHQKTAWERIKSASRGTDISLANLNGLSNAMLAHVSTMTHLKSIDLAVSSGFTAEGVKHLYRLPQLETLDLSSTDISDNALIGIGSLVGLKFLHIHCTNVTDAGLTHLTCLSSLQDLRLSECKGVTNAGMVHVGRFSGLEELRLGWTPVTDDGLRQLSALTKLKTFRLPNGDMVYNEDVRRWIGK